MAKKEPNLKKIPAKGYTPKKFLQRQSASKIKPGKPKITHLHPPSLF